MEDKVVEGGHTFFEKPQIKAIREKLIDHRWLAFAKLQVHASVPGTLDSPVHKAT